MQLNLYGNNLALYIYNTKSVLAVNYLRNTFILKLHLCSSFIFKKKEPKVHNMQLKFCIMHI